MTTLQQQNNEAQYTLAKEGMDTYRNILLIRKGGYDSSSIANGIQDLLQSMQGRSFPPHVIVTFQKSAKKVIEDLKSKRMFVRQEKKIGIEIIINQYASTDIIIPVKQEDLTIDGHTLADKLYKACEEACDELGYVTQEAEFHGYKVLSLPKEVDRRQVAQQILRSAPKEFGGGRSCLALYLRCATNFSFSYKQSDSPTQKIVQEPGTLTREDAIDHFKRGIMSPELAKRFPDIPRMRIAGWQAAWTRGAYKNKN